MQFNSFILLDFDGLGGGGSSGSSESESLRNSKLKNEP